MSNTSTQIVVLKGWEGLADRLQVLSHCLHYCKLHKAAICIDWRDHMWGQLTLDFSDYFEIIGIPFLPLSKVLEKVSAGATISPTSWDLESLTSEPNESIHFSEYESAMDNAYGYINADIIVNYGKGLRTWHIDNLICNIRLKKSISDIISERLSKLESPYTLIHLRGTDRLSKMHPEQSMQSAVTIFDLQPPHIKARHYVISDMKLMVQLWKKVVKDSRSIYNDYEIYKLPPGSQGTHTLHRAVLDFYGVKKHQLNIDAIADFLMICFSDWSFSNCKDSVYSSLAAFMRQGGKKGLAKWLHGFKPTIVELK